MNIPGMILVGWVILNETGTPRRPETMRNWYDKKPTAGPAKIYKTKKIAERYGEPCPVYIPSDELQGVM